MNDWNEFQETSPVSPPAALSQKVLGLVQRDLNPGAWSVFSKLSLIHFFSALFTLSVCPQFGFRLFGSGMGPMTYFMQWGTTACGMACGALFTGTSLWLAALFLKPIEVRTIRAHRFLKLAAITLLSLGFFVMLRTEIVLGFALAWIVGSVLGGWLSLELGWLLRKPLKQ